MKSVGEEEEESMRVEDKGGEEQSGGRALLLASRKMESCQFSAFLIRMIIFPQLLFSIDPVELTDCEPELNTRLQS